MPVCVQASAQLHGIKTSGIFRLQTPASRWAFVFTCTSKYNRVHSVYRALSNKHTFMDKMKLALGLITIPFIFSFLSGAFNWYMDDGAYIFLGFLMIVGLVWAWVIEVNR